MNKITISKKVELYFQTVIICNIITICKGSRDMSYHKKCFTYTRLKKIIFCIGILILMFITVTMPVKINAASSDFTITNGVLVKYHGNSKKIIIPKGVTAIGNRAFYNTSVTEVIIPVGVTKIGEWAFYSRSLEKVTIPDGVIEIEKGAFSRTKLTSIVIPDSVTTIGEKAFETCVYIKKIKLSKGLIIIGNAAFSNCNKVTAITIFDGVKSIGDRAFAGCDNLRSISLPKSVESIGINIFSNNSSLISIKVSSENPNYAVVGNLLFNKNKTILLSYSNATDEIVIPEGVEEIADELFSYCNFRKVTFPSTLKKIGDNVFYNCLHLEEFSLPSSLITYGKQNFSNCPKLKKVTVFETEGQKNFLSENGVLYNGDKTVLFCNPEAGDIVVPETVTNIGSYAFPNVRISVTIPSSVTSLGENIFVNEDSEWTPANKTPLTIYGYEGSAIKEYCENSNWGVRFLALDGTYTIKYNLKGGINNSSNPRIYARDTDTIVLKAPARRGYILKYWYEDYSECEDGCHRGEREIKQIQKGTLGNIILNAKWEKVNTTQGKIISVNKTTSTNISVHIQPVLEAVGYQLVYAKNSKFTNGKNAISIRTTERVIENLDLASTYYIKVRAYKIDSAGKRVYGEFSKVNIIKL